MQGVSTIFGYPGSNVLDLYDELPGSGIRHILVRHEQAAAHAADGYARATGSPGVCMATSGPGACNLVCGIATAFMDSIPLVALTGQVPTDLIGTMAFQEADTPEIVRTVTKYAARITAPGDICSMIDKAFYLCRSGRSGPVLLDLPSDVLAADILNDLWDRPVAEYASSPPVSPAYRTNILKAATMILQAEKPVIYTGGGTILSGASAELVTLAELLGIPVVASLLGISSIPSDYPCYLGMAGMFGSVAANLALHETDLLIAVGVRFSDRICATGNPIAPQAQVIHIDIDPGEIGKNRAVDLPVIGDAKDTLSRIIKEIREKVPSPSRVRVSGENPRAASDPGSSGRIHPHEVITALSSMMDDDAIIVSEVGQNQMWTAQQFMFKKTGSYLTSGGFGTMGYGLPAALGASTGCPSRQVVLIAGDGSFQMNIQELATIAAYHVPVKIVILNNNSLGMIRQWQEQYYDRRYSFSDLPSPDFVRIGSGFGIDGMQIEDPADLHDGITTVLSSEGPFLLDARIDPEVNVYPVIPRGKTVHGMITGD
jgi:acetolactate synthase-1/2/3 large subunit